MYTRRNFYRNTVVSAFYPETGPGPGPPMNIYLLISFYFFLFFTVIILCFKIVSPPLFLSAESVCVSTTSSFHGRLTSVHIRVRIITLISHGRPHVALLPSASAGGRETVAPCTTDPYCRRSIREALRPQGTFTAEVHVRSFGPVVWPTDQIDLRNTLICQAVYRYDTYYEQYRRTNFLTDGTGLAFGRHGGLRLLVFCVCACVLLLLLSMGLSGNNVFFSPSFPKIKYSDKFRRNM